MEVLCKSKEADCYVGDVVIKDYIAYMVAELPDMTYGLVCLEGERAGEIHEVFRTLAEIDAIISDQRIGHRHCLSCVGRVCQHLQIACHRGIEHDLTDHFFWGTDAGSGKNVSVFKYEKSLHLFYPFKQIFLIVVHSCSYFK